MASVRHEGGEWAMGIGSRSATARGAVKASCGDKKGRGQEPCPEGFEAIADPPARGVSRSAEGGAACGGDGLPEKGGFEFISAPFLVLHEKAFHPPLEKGAEKGLVALRRTTRRRERYELRSKALWRLSSLERVCKCGRVMTGAMVATRLRDQVAHFSGLAACGSIHACPVCSAKIRAYRADEIDRAATRHLEQGGAAWMVSLTTAHDRGDDLGELLKTISAAFSALLAGRASAAERKRYGITGHIRVLEVTHGGSGWHPHLHVLLLFERELDGVGLAKLANAWYERWARVIVSRGYRAPSRIYGVQWSPVEDAEGLARYVTKVQEDGLRAHVGSELTRSDMKRGRYGSRTPFQILADFLQTGDKADLALWYEYEQASKGRQVMRWSDGLRGRLLVEPEKTDDEIAAQEVGGEDIAWFDTLAWRTLVRVPGLPLAVLETVEVGGYEAVVVLCGRYGVEVLRPPDSIAA